MATKQKHVVEKTAAKPNDKAERTSKKGKTLSPVVVDAVDKLGKLSFQAQLRRRAEHIVKQTEAQLGSKLRRAAEQVNVRLQ
jgi:hypothetical protein